MMTPYLMSQVMTPQPISIHPVEKLSRAQELLEKHGIRHLPVVAGDREVVGMLSERDLRLARSFRYPDSLRVHELMKEHPYSVTLGSSVAEALRLMADFKAEAIAVISGRRTLQGIFTRHDALQVVRGAMDAQRAPGLAA